MKTVVTFMLEPEILEKLKALAAKTDRTQSWHIRKAIEKYLKSQK